MIGLQNEPITAIYDCDDTVSGVAPGKGPGTACAGPVTSGAPLPPTVLGGTDDTFSVTATNGAGLTNTVTPTYHVRPAPPELILPSADETTNDRTPEFQWNASVNSSVDHYTLFVNNAAAATVPAAACVAGVCTVTAARAAGEGAGHLVRAGLRRRRAPEGLDHPHADRRHERPRAAHADRRAGRHDDRPDADVLVGRRRTPVQVADQRPRRRRGARPVHHRQRAGHDLPRAARRLLPVPGPPGRWQRRLRLGRRRLVHGRHHLPAVHRASRPGPWWSPSRPRPRPRPPIITKKKSTKKGSKAVLTPKTLNATLLTPKAGAKIRDLTPTLRWKKRPKGAQIFNLQIFQGTHKVLSRFPTGLSYTVPAGVLKPGKQYIWRVWPYFGSPAATRRTRSA